ncbi:hypothetical protein [Streptomyces sp. NBC_01216]|uniref:hypothetical protein n=1 Tax=Streptomyces sp. NBC_01216 TaxID=2903778 RepID=UPI002E141387
MRRLAKLVPTSPEVIQLIDADNDADAGREHIIRAVPVVSYTETSTPDGDSTTWPETTQPGSGTVPAADDLDEQAKAGEQQ